MYNTSAGERVLRGAERRLFVESLGMMVDHLSTDDCDFVVAIFDNLQRNQKVAALHTIARALLCNDASAPRLTAVVEGAVASVYQHALEMLFQEIELQTDDLDDRGDCIMPTWRELAFAAGQESELEELPTPDSWDKEHWDFLIHCLEGKVLWDNDWEADDRLDVAPEESRRLKSELGIPDDYYIAVPPDPSDEQASQLLAELRDLTAECR